MPPLTAYHPAGPRRLAVKLDSPTVHGPPTPEILIALLFEVLRNLFVIHVSAALAVHRRTRTDRPACHRARGFVTRRAQDCSRGLPGGRS
jgi:hypothetical protein